MKRVNYLGLILLSLLMLQSCSSDEENNDNPPDSQEESVLCTGNGSESYWPLVLGNQWVYEGSNDNLILDVEQEVEINGQLYYKIEPSGDLAWEAIYLREDSQGNIYRSSSPSSEANSEVLYLPANPVLNQEWDSFGICIIGSCTHYKKVESLTYTIETDDCVYENCLAIREYTILNDGTLLDEGLLFYKQGIGYLGADGLSSYLDLSGITLN